MAGLSTTELAVILHPQFSNLRTARGTLARLPSVGGTPRTIADSVQFADWSPKGELLLVRAEGTRSVLESPPGKLLFTSKEGWISNARFSRSGKRIAFLHHPVVGNDLGEVVVLDGAGKAVVTGRRWGTTFGLAWTPDDSEVWYTGGQARKNAIHALTLEGRERVVFSSPGWIELEDVSPTGDVLLVNSLSRVDLQYLSKSGTQRLLSFTDWNSGVAAVSDSGEVLFGVEQPYPTEENLEEGLSVLRKVDGSATRVLGDGYPLDLSADGRWALVESTDATQLTALPTGTGQPRTFETRGLSVTCGRFLPGDSAVLAIGRPPSGDDRGLYVVNGKGTDPHQLGRLRLSSTHGVLHLSPDGRVAAALGSDGRLMLIALSDGSELPVPEELATMIPRGWSAGGHLWLSQGGDSAPAKMRLIRVEPTTGRILEERTILLSELAAAGRVGSTQISRNGEHVVFHAIRNPGTLSIVRGLWTPTK
jgi:hypothetical protein